MKILIFDLCGPFAHFRKYYTNASSLSYGIPPRTVLAGLIAAILGKEKDSYYEELGTDQVKIGVSLKTPYRKMMQTLNYYSPKDLIQNKTLRYQVPVEILLPAKDEKEICYRIYYADNNQNRFNELKDRIFEKRFVYNPYLGISEFLADIEYIATVENPVKMNQIETPVEIVTGFKKSHILENSLSVKADRLYHLERMPVNFKNHGEDQRNLYLFDNYIYEDQGRSILAKIKPEIGYYSIEYLNTKENIIFME